MAAASEVIGRFPIDRLFFIVAAGLFLVLSFPYDIRTSVSNGSLRFPATLGNNSSDYISGVREYFESACKNLTTYLCGDFTPFVSVKYLSDFPNGFVETLLLSLPVGAIFFVFYDAIQSVNHLVRHPKDFEMLLSISLCEHEANKDSGKSLSKTEKKERLQNTWRWDWINCRGYRKYIDFHSSINAVITGILFAGEAFFLVVLVSASIVFMSGLDPQQPLPFRLFMWVPMALLMLGIFYVAYLIDTRTLKRAWSFLDEGFRAEEEAFSVPKIVYCYNCGTENISKSISCSKCGATILKPE